MYIQSKYCATGSRCINECFEENGKGNFRYYIDGGKPMQIEVPSDKYEAALESMQEKIRRGQIKGITDPKEAKNIVRKGNFTYEQAKNIAKAGTIESLSYDAVNGMVICASAFGITTILTFATSIWNGQDFEKSLKLAGYSGLKVGGTALVVSILSSQLSKAGLNSALVNSSEMMVSFMGPKASALLVNAFRNGTKIYGAAAMKRAAKLLRGNMITSGLTVMVLSTFDIADIFQGKISGKQLFKNITNTTSTVVGGTGGWLAGSAIGSAICPGIGTFVGGLIGSTGVGTVAEKASETIVGEFIEDDATEMVTILEKVFEKMVKEYLLNQKEVEKSVDRLQDKLNGKILKNMYASDNRDEFARELLKSIIEKQVAMRPKIPALSIEEMLYGIRTALEEISDEIEDKDINDNGESISEMPKYRSEYEKFSSYEQIEAEKLYNEGENYYLGRGKNIDEKKAFEFYSRAASLGYAKAQYKVARCYEFGRGINKNMTNASIWYRKAAEQGHTEAQKKINDFIKTGYTSGRIYSIAESSNYVTEATAEDILELGEAYYLGRGRKVDERKAAELYAKAAVMGHARAQYKFGLCCEFGRGCPKNVELAYKSYMKAAQQGDKDAQQKIQRLNH